MIYWQLFETFFLVGLFSFGGGYASMELIRTRVVTQRQWLTNMEYTDVISIAEMTPGPMGINIASFVGTRVAGILGTVVATFSYVLPSLFIVMFMAKLYEKYRSLSGMQGVLKGLRPAVAAMLTAALLRLTLNAFWGEGGAVSLPDTNVIAVALAAVIFLLLQKKKLNAIQAILLSGVVGAVIYAITGL